jgi:hypothetical protein
MRCRVARLALTAGLALCVPSVAGAHAPDTPADDEPAVQRMLIQLKLEHGGKTLTHPGHMTETGSEIILVLTQGKHKHEVSVYLEKKGKGFKAEVKYSTGGKVVLEEVTTLKDKTWGSVHKGKTKISLRVDTSAKRPDELDLPDGDNPLDGLK